MKRTGNPKTRSATRSRPPRSNLRGKARAYTMLSRTVSAKACPSQAARKRRIHPASVIDSLCRLRLRRGQGFDQQIGAEWLEKHRKRAFLTGLYYCMGGIIAEAGHHHGPGVRLKFANL